MCTCPVSKWGIRSALLTQNEVEYNLKKRSKMGGRHSYVWKEEFLLLKLYSLASCLKDNMKETMNYGKVK